MLSSGGDHIFETRFFEPGGRSVSVPSDWFGGDGFALSLSRARMDQILLDEARRRGAVVMQETAVTGLVIDNDVVRGVRVRRPNGTTTEIEASIAVDATGRARVLSKLADKHAGSAVEHKPKFVGFKVHLTGAHMPRGVCEIYAFRGGYAGLSFVEDGEANLCFLARASLLSENSDADIIIDGLRRQNVRAGETLASARKTHDWLAVSVPAFGFNRQAAVDGLFTVGDSAAFIDPFTGSGMLMAIESVNLLSKCVADLGFEHKKLREHYDRLYHENFRRRLRVSGLLRHVAYTPALGRATVRLLSLSERLRLALARKTRSAVV